MKTQGNQSSLKEIEWANGQSDVKTQGERRMNDVDVEGAEGQSEMKTQGNQSSLKGIEWANGQSDMKTQGERRMNDVDVEGAEGQSEMKTQGNQRSLKSLFKIWNIDGIKTGME